MRGGAVLWRVGVLIAWLGALAAFFVAGSGTATLYALAGLPLTVGVGALVDRWWVLLVPWVVEVVALILFIVISGPCTDCADGEGWGDWILLAAAFFTIPASVLLLIGVAGRRGARFFAGLDEGPDPEPT
jgi:hypothetical protein